MHYKSSNKTAQIDLRRKLSQYQVQQFIPKTNTLVQYTLNYNIASHFFLRKTVTCNGLLKAEYIKFVLLCSFMRNMPNPSLQFHIFPTITSNSYKSKMHDAFICLLYAFFIVMLNFYGHEGTILRRYWRMFPITHPQKMFL